MTCAKLRVICKIQAADGTTVVADNGCDNPQEVCPREPGEGYEKCRTICQQRGHAEEQALEAAREGGVSTEDAAAFIYGHYWMCEPCGAALRDAGVSAIVIQQKT